MLKNISKEIGKYIDEGKLQLNKVQTVLSIIVAVCNVMLSKVEYVEKLQHEKVRHSHDVGLDQAGLDTSIAVSGTATSSGRASSPPMLDDDEEKSLYYAQVIKLDICG